MKKITIELTELQEEFLKQFAERQFKGSKDNVSTYKPLHFVQRQRSIQIGDIPDFVADMYHLIYTPDDKLQIDPDCEDFIDELCEVVLCETDEDEEDDEYLDYLDYHNYDEYVESEGFEGYFTKKVEMYIKSHVHDVGDFFQADFYIELFEEFQCATEHIEIIASNYYWEDVAFFFILEEAKRYMEYQKHNLGVSRTYTKSMGYSNYGEFEHFYDLLMDMGRKLNHDHIDTSLKINYEDKDKTMQIDGF